MAEADQWPTAITFSSGIARLLGLAAALGVVAVERRTAFGWPNRRPDGDAVVVGWGLKPNTRPARRFAARHALPYLTLEDGFLRSVGLGVAGARPYAVVMDDLGIYYDARRPSRLENLLNGEPVSPLPGDGGASAGDPLQDTALLDRARRCIDAVVAARLSKYNVSPERELPPATRPRVLVVDQTAGDLAVAHGLADADSFRAMLAAARDENPDAEILIKTHPDVLGGHRRGYFGAADADARTRLLTEDINPIHLVQQVDRVYVVTSQLGFEALLAGKPVTCFGAPFYSGWGLTDDRCPVARRRRTRSLEQVFAAAYLLYSRYMDPDSGERCELERVIEHLALQRRWFARNAGTWLGFGISWWKRWYVRRYLRSPGNDVRFYQRASAIPAGLDPASTRVLVWGLRDTPALRHRAAACGYPVWRMEDGFLRSVGLGTDLTTPVSQVIDGRGIYFDPTRPSDLEHILAHSAFTPDDLARARALRERLLATRLSKYNLAPEKGSVAHGAAAGQAIILVPGQVEGDAALRLGCRDIDSNAKLLAEVRRSRPDAYILYKPHPDVLSGNRRRDQVQPAADDYDQLVTDTSITACLDVADEVHTMASLVGFEALLRGLAVVTYGLPFYAGWGLTQDRHTIARRGRRLSLDELVAGVLIRYPRYVNDASGEFTTPEQVVERLGRTLAGGSTRRPRRGLAYRVTRSLLAFATGVGRELGAARR